jgi:hypothetical protein
MENFITGYPGHEGEMRAAMLEVLGQEKYDYFFDKVSLATYGFGHRKDILTVLTTVPRVLLHVSGC